MHRSKKTSVWGWLGWFGLGFIGTAIFLLSFLQLQWSSRLASTQDESPRVRMLVEAIKPSRPCSHQPESVNSRNVRVVSNVNDGSNDERLNVAHPTVNVQALPREPERFFHVTREGTAVEGGILVILDSIMHPNGGATLKYYDQRVWRATGCGKNYLYLQGGCYWCSAREPGICSTIGSLRLSQFKDDHKSYSLKSRGTLELLKMRPATEKTIGKAVFDSMYITCEGLDGIPLNEPGQLFVENMPTFVHQVNPRVPNTNSEKRTENIVCTKSFYGTGMNTQTVTQFTIHYLERWKFDRIYMYELGTTVGRTIMDIIRSSERLSSYFRQNQIVVIDFRDELQRLYGPIAGDVILFTSKNAQLIVSADCFTRAKLSAVNWVLPLDWDELLTLGSDHRIEELGKKHRPSFDEWTTMKSKELKMRTNKDARMIIFNRFISSESNVCEECKKDWDEKAAWALHVREESEMRKAQQAHIELRSKNSSQVAGEQRVRESNSPLESFEVDPNFKYAIRMQNQKTPFSWGYGVHVLSRCANTLNRFEKHTTTANFSDVYIRHYKCMNKRSSCDKAKHSVLNWAHRFGSPQSVGLDQPKQEVTLNESLPIDQGIVSVNESFVQL